MNLNSKTLALLGAFALVSIPLVASAAEGDDPNAANKASAAGSTVEILSVADATETVLSTTVKTSPGQDLILGVTLECALWTTVETVGNDESTARATVEITVLFDGVAVPVSGDSDDGQVVFCDRVHRQTTSLFDDDDATINSYLQTRSANAFNWILPDAGQGDHTVEVVADLTTFSDSDLLVKAGVGHRTLVVEPTHLPQGFEL